MEDFTYIDPNEETPDWIKWIHKKISILALDTNSKRKLTERITKEFQPNAAYWAEIVLSTVIATLGLLQDSVAVVIGAMLIAPLFKPIELLTFGIATGHSKRMIRGLKILITSTLVAILVALIIAYVIPLKTETAEILARTAPNLLDLFVALASAVVVFMALSSSRFTESIAGVAMATALIPPLAVTGIELAFGNQSQMGGSILLYATNLLAIMVVGVIVFLFYGYIPHQRLKKLNTIKSFVVVITLVALISIPLVASLQLISDKINIEYTAQNYLTDILDEKIPGASLDTLEVRDFNRDKVSLLGTIKVPEESDFFLETKNSITEELGNVLNRDVDLTIQIIPVASIISIEQAQVSNQIPVSEQLKENFKNFLSIELPTATIINLETFSINEDETKWGIKVLMALANNETISTETETELNQKFVSQNQNQDISIAWTIIPQIQPVTSKTEYEKASEAYLRTLTLRWEGFLSGLIPADASFDNFQLNWKIDPLFNKAEDFNSDYIGTYSLAFDLYLPQDMANQSESIKNAATEFADEIFATDNQIKIRVFTFQNQKIIN